MDDELQKRNIDCVFFLASPLTCKKGMECEFRHSEFARLNPTDCWYWLSGNCLNPSCGFRHPPLEAHNPSGVDPPQQCFVPKTHTGVPCYFYYRGFCSKSNNCAYLHSNLFIPSSSAAKPLKKGSEDKKLSGSVVSLVPNERCLGSSKPTLKAEADSVLSQSKIDLQKLPSDSVVVKLTGEAIVGTTPPTEELLNCKVHDNAVSYTEELYDLSPDPKASRNLLSLNPHHRELNSPVLDHDFEEPDEYDPMHPDAGIVCKYKTTYDSCSDLEDYHSVDLRDGLRRRHGKRIDDDPSPALFRRERSFDLIGFRWERLEGNGFRFSRKGRFLNGSSKRVSLRRSRTSTTRQHFKGRRQFRSAATKRKSFPRIRRYNNVDDSSFAGPMSLEQIREEERRRVRAEEQSKCSGKFSMKNPFTGPNPLFELRTNK